MEDAFEFIIKNGGLTLESNCPYVVSDGKSKGGSNSSATIKSYEEVPVNNEGALMKAVANQPVSVSVDGGDMTFQFYSGGIMSGSCGTDLDQFYSGGIMSGSCGTDLHHGIAAIGYGQ